MRRSLVLPGFALSTAAVYGACVAAVGAMGAAGRPDVFARAVTADLTLFVPVLFYLFLVRGRRLPLVSVVPVFLLSLAGAALVLPDAHEQALHVVGYLGIPAELLVLGFVGVKAVQTAGAVRRSGAESGAGAFYDRVRTAARDTLGPNVGSEVLATEIALAYYAAAGWRHSAPTDPGAFSAHRRSGYATVVGVLSVVMAVETVGLHLVVSRWSPTAAWALTLLSLYGLVWIGADYQAIRLRPIRLSPRSLDVRVGLRWSVTIPFEAVVGLYRVESRPPDRKEAGYVRAVLSGDARYYVTLREPVEARGAYGIRTQATKVGFTVDEPERFEAAFDERFEAWKRRPGAARA